MITDTFAQAVNLVGDDQRQGYPEWSNAKAVEYVRRTLDLDDLAEAGGEPGDPLYDAYALVLTDRREVS